MRILLTVGACSGFSASVHAHFISGAAEEAFQAATVRRTRFSAAFNSASTTADIIITSWRAVCISVERTIFPVVFVVVPTTRPVLHSRAPGFTSRTHSSGAGRVHLGSI